MKKIIVVLLDTILMSIIFATASSDIAPDQVEKPDHVFRASNVKTHPYNGPRSTPTLVDQIDLSSINTNGYCWGLTYDWETDALWISQWNSAYPWVYAISKTSPCVKLDSFQLGSGAPSYHLGMGFAGSNVLYMAGLDDNIYEIDMSTGAGSVFRTLPWSSAEGLGFNAFDDAIYPGDWSVDQCAWAQPAQSGSWNTWSLTGVSGLSGAYAASSPEYLFTVDAHISQAHFYQHSVIGGVPNTMPDSVWDCDSGQTQSGTADCAFDGQYVYILDQSGPDMIWVYDVGITPQDFHDVGVIAVHVEPYVPPGQPVDIAVTYGNFGDFTETFDAYVVIDSAGVNIYNETASLTLDPGADTTIDFPPWTSGPNGGFYDGYTYTYLVGDMNPANDTMSFPITIVPYYWEILADLPVQSSGHYGATLYDGFYMIFGIHPSGQYLDDTYIYDIINDIWSLGPTNPYGCGAYGMAFGVDSIYYRFGGTDGWPTPLDRVDIYDPGLGIWSSGVTMPIPNMDMAGGVYKDSLIYMFGGGNWGGSVYPHTDVYFYDAYEDTWTQATSIPGQGRGCLAGGVVGDYAVVACGYDGTSNYLADYIVGNIDPADPANISWGSQTPIPGFEGRYRLCYAVDPSPDQELWVACGTGISPYNDICSYDPVTDTWTYWNSPPYAANNISCCAMTNTALGDIGFFIPGSDNHCHIVFHTLKPGIKEESAEQTTYSVFGFAVNIKNPTRGHSGITYTTTMPGRVSIKIYDNTGRLIKTLVNRINEPAGTKTAFWNAKDDNGRTVANGIYFIKLEAENKTDTYKMVLIK